MSHCPSCGRYVGPYEACPYCGVYLTKRIPIRTIKITTVILASVGLVILWFAATRAEVPLIKIGQTRATMNLAYVRVAGRCTSVPTYNSKETSLGFWVEDETGELYASSYGAEASALIEGDCVPALGDLVEVTGTLRVREDFHALTINAPDQVRITRAEPIERDIGTIAPEDQYLRVRVRGQVRDIQRPYQGLTLVTLRDVTGSIPLVVSKDVLALNGISLTLSTGQSVEVAASVSLYEGLPQLTPATLADIVPLDQPVAVAVERNIGELTATEVGQFIAVRGTVIDTHPFSAGVKVTLDDGTGTIVLLLWQSVYDELRNGIAPEIGAQVQVQGEVSHYRGELEVIPESPHDVQILAGAPSPPDCIPIGELTTADVGRWVTLCGVLSPPHPFSAGVKFTLDDGTGQIVLLMWQDIYENVPEGLGTGAHVIATGQVAEYQGELELTNLNAGKIQVTSPGEPVIPTPSPSSEAERRAINDITPADIGQVLTLMGTLGEPETFSKGIKFPLDDTSGNITLLLWQNVYDAIPDADRLIAGARVEVEGHIDEYQGHLEIIPEADGVEIVE
jgi:DNA/RNA endonuclease YhcR with UshA esterase domain